MLWNWCVHRTELVTPNTFYFSLFTMARPIKETPILFGEDARRFEERMKQIRTETQEEREQRLADFKLGMEMLERGKRR